MAEKLGGSVDKDLLARGVLEERLRQGRILRRRLFRHGVRPVIGPGTAFGRICDERLCKRHGVIIWWPGDRDLFAKRQHQPDIAAIGPLFQCDDLRVFAAPVLSRAPDFAARIAERHPLNANQGWEIKP